MAYDSATDTALAGQAYQRALAVAAQRRTQLNSQFGLNTDGSMNNSEAGHLGSIYQGNLDSVNADHQAELADRRRGFGGRGGLAGKATAAADQAAQQRQALGLQGAAQQLGGVVQDEQFAGQDYESAKSNIGSKSSYDLAQTLAANPVYGTPAPTPGAPGNPYSGPQIGGSLTNYKQLFKANPKKFSTIKGKF